MIEGWTRSTAQESQSVCVLVSISEVKSLSSHHSQVKLAWQSFTHSAVAIVMVCELQRIVFVSLMCCTQHTLITCLSLPVFLVTDASLMVWTHVWGGTFSLCARQAVRICFWFLGLAAQEVSSFPVAFIDCECVSTNTRGRHAVEIMVTHCSTMCVCRHATSDWMNFSQLDVGFGVQSLPSSMLPANCSRSPKRSLWSDLNISNSPTMSKSSLSNSIRLAS